MKSSHNHPVTLEDLLRLKRAERPSPQFWVQFERDLREKQLAAIMSRRPWWAPMLRGWVRFGHLQMPLGATAILALTFLTAREYRVPNVDAGLVPVVAHAPGGTGFSEAAARSAVTTATEGMEGSRVLAALTRENEADQPARMPSLGDVAHVVPLLNSPTLAVETPSARSIAANLAAAQIFNPELTETLAGTVDIPANSSMRRVDPLSRISKPSDARRARLLGGSLPASPMYASASWATDDASHERLTSRLEDRLYDSVHRFAADGRSVSIKF